MAIAGYCVFRLRRDTERRSLWSIIHRRRDPQRNLAMHVGLFVTLETESRFDVGAHLADLTAQVRTARDAGFGSLWFPQHFVTGPSMRQFAASPIMGYL